MKMTIITVFYFLKILFVLIPSRYSAIDSSEQMIELYSPLFFTGFLADRKKLC
jgi:hypothetical protein